MTSGKSRNADKTGNGEFMLPVPISGDWTMLVEEQAQLLITRLSECNFPGISLTNGARVRILPLPFWERWILCDVQPHHVERKAPAGNRIGRMAEREAEMVSRETGKDEEEMLGAVHSFAYGPDGFLPLDGTSALIHQHNALHGVDLSTTALQHSYLRFFCFFVRGENGPFEVLEDPARLAGKAGREFAGKLKPLEALKEKPPKGKEKAGLHVASIHYGTSLFAARFALHATGMVEMLDDDLIGDDVGLDPDLRFRGTARWQNGGEVAT